MVVACCPKDIGRPAANVMLGSNIAPTPAPNKYNIDFDFFNVSPVLSYLQNGDRAAPLETVQKRGAIFNSQPSADGLAHPLPSTQTWGDQACQVVV